MNTQAYFEDIQNHLKQTLQIAQKEILVAVAWFTDEELFTLLCQKAQKQIKISVALLADEINQNAYRLDWTKLENLGAKIWRVPTQAEQLMHHKFCVIDGQIVITGSYNWTNKAQRNDENITIVKDSPDFAQSFIQAFQNLLKKYFGAESTLIDYGAIGKRLEILKNTLALGDAEDIDYQANKLQQLLPPILPAELAIITSIQDCLQQKAYGEAVRQITAFLVAFQALTIFIDPEIGAMRLEIRSLALQISSLEDEKAEMERLLHAFSVRHQQMLGALLLEILKLHQQLAEQTAQAEPDNETAQAQAEEARQDYEQYEQTYSNEPTAEIPILNEAEQKELKNLYRQATKLCHPDTVSELDQTEAQALFVELQSAYENNDLPRVKEINEELKTQKIFKPKHQTISEKDLLQAEVKRLQHKLQTLMQSLTTLKNSETYLTIAHIQDWESYFTDTQTRLQAELDNLKTQLQNGKPR